MIIYGLMKYVETVPDRYDNVMNFLTAGNHSKAHDFLLSHVKQGMKVLDIGCGPGNIAVKCAQKGAQVYAVDASVEMLRMLNERIEGTPEEKDITVIECGAGSIQEVLKDEKFDLIMASLMLGELPPLVRTKTLNSAAKLLKDDGFILINDELWPENMFVSALYHIFFWIFFIPNFLLTRTMIRPVKNLNRDLATANLKVTEKKSMFGGVMSILKIHKK